MSLITGLLSNLWPYILMAGGALLGLWQYGRTQKKAGEREQVAKQAAADKKAADTAHRVDQEVDALKPADARAELKKWSRKP